MPLLRTRWLPVALVALLGFATACTASSPVTKGLVVEVRVTDYAGAAVGGAALFAGSNQVALTTADGIATLEMRGREGDLVALEVRCPDGYESPIEKLVVQSLDVDGSTPSHLTRCRKIRHRLVIAVRAEGGPNLPVLRLGRVVGTTDASGAASLLFDLDLEERVELTLSTESLANEGVTPKNPVVVFDLHDENDVKLFDVKLTRPRAKQRRGPAKKRGPVSM